MSQVLEVFDLLKRFDGSPVPAVQHLSLSIQPGEIHALTGESGSGKSTTLRMIAGFEYPQAGRILLNGRCITNPSSGVGIPPEKRRIGMVFQDHALFPHLTVEQNIAFGLRDRKLRQRVEDLLDIVHLQPFRSRYPHQISGGQAQRVALARALAPDPELLLMDEPFNSLDTRLKQHLLPQIRQAIKSTGTPTLFVTHDRNEAFDLADRISVLHRGQLQQTGTPQEIYDAPISCYVAEFFGRANMLRADKQTLMIRPEQILLTLPGAQNPGESSGTNRSNGFKPESRSLERLPQYLPVTLELIESFYRGYHWELGCAISQSPEAKEFIGQGISCYSSTAPPKPGEKIQAFLLQEALRPLLL